MKLGILIKHLESFAPLQYQEDYDNSGLLVGNPDQEIFGALVALDCTEDIIGEAIANSCNLVITHHPIIFKGLKRITGSTYTERVVQKALKNDIAIYAIHTNLDSVKHGVNGMICKRLGLRNTRVLRPKGDLLRKLVTFCPMAHADEVREALFSAGAGHIGQYSECSFNSPGFGTFKAGEGTEPYVGERDILHEESELRIETVFLAKDQRKILLALLESHPYEEVAYDIIPLANGLDTVGSGMIGWLEQETDCLQFMNFLKDRMDTNLIRHTTLLPKKIRRVAVCGGSGSFLIKDAIAQHADVFITSDLKYHEFFDADGKIVLMDIGHFESEQFTCDLLIDIIQEKFPNFAVRLTERNTNPINYFV
ncbi:Nif3-like dinuclear metal center hexameric protein [Pedobacter faecalis]|uniref:Nif3-like dinuclear metal center hexameric protein n=1 Tax=Pedobacter faecalis TaxID=3041495 RepID=UPI00254FF53E|nr:Nif3-like dinuclear metal center hexameric protein [Pedobacter sp. ELA7]